MKKYLMTGIAALAMCAAFTSCSHDTGFETMTQEDLDKAKYEATFVARFGQPAADQDWGFGQFRANAVTRAASTNMNQWEDQGWIIPEDVTAAEIAAVREVFDQVGEASYTSLVDWSDFFVVQVYKGEASYYNHSQYVDNDVTKGLKPNEKPNVVGSQHMDWLCTRTNKKVVVTNYNPYTTEVQTVAEYDDHINNFNNGNCTTSATSEKTGRTIKNMMLMVNSNTNVFGFKSSEDNGHVFYNFRMEKIGNYYYVGFDFEANGNNPNEKVDRDYIYNDWIVRIVPGKGVTPPPSTADVRVIAEDLTVSEKGDFDFNDVVFDVYYNYNNTGKTAIMLQAAGGTYPLYVADHEVHAEFGQPTNVMINTGAGPNCDPVLIQLDEAYTDANDILVQVDKGKGLETLTAEVGRAPHKIAVIPSFPIMHERDDIETHYKGFGQWVQDPQYRWY